MRSSSAALLHLSFVVVISKVAFDPLDPLHQKSWLVDNFHPGRKGRTISEAIRDLPFLKRSTEEIKERKILLSEGTSKKSLFAFFLPFMTVGEKI